jgi:hypothetical protein
LTAGCIGHEKATFPDLGCGSAAAARVSLMMEPAANAVTAIPAAAIPGTDFLIFMNDNLQAIADLTRDASVLLLDQRPLKEIFGKFDIWLNSC